MKMDFAFSDKGLGREDGSRPVESDETGHDDQGRLYYVVARSGSRDQWRLRMVPRRSLAAWLHGKEASPPQHWPPCRIAASSILAHHLTVSLASVSSGVLLEPPLGQLPARAENDASQIMRRPRAPGKTTKGPGRRLMHRPSIAGRFSLASLAA